ncbi:hypothetical protein [Pollutimonas sp. M17]|uniref:hypothetical protein n=1 Tax=Pollutimonas sp. M17 TaxID=2962065 RepID=UPI0021F3E201|nr:hypothetical protein [Pollutimonas sp. M17]UYO94433.1 hypothetical protein OEG81_03610 [Pollutimonas sp. M17]
MHALGWKAESVPPGLKPQNDFFVARTRQFRDDSAIRKSTYKYMFISYGYEEHALIGLRRFHGRPKLYIFQRFRQSDGHVMR